MMRDDRGAGQAVPPVAADRSASACALLAEVGKTLVLLALLCMIAGWGLDRLPAADRANVNRAFVGGAWPVLAGTGVVLLAVGEWFRRRRRGRPLRTGLDLADLPLLLLPLTPLVQYCVHNQNIMTTADVASLGAAGLVLGAVVAGILPALGRRVWSVRTVAIGALMLLYVLVGMADLTARQSWFERGNLSLQLGLLGGGLAVGLLLDGYLGRRFLRAIVMLFFVGNTLQAAWGGAAGDDIGAGSAAADTVAAIAGDRLPVRTPGISILVYDAYVGSATMEQYGIDNSEQERKLKDLGFRLYPATYSIASNTLATMSRVFEVSRKLPSGPRRVVAGDGAVPRLLRRAGYETWGMFYSDYFFLGETVHWDRSFPPPSDVRGLMAKAVMMGEFRFDVEFGNPSPEEFLAAKSRLLASVPERPRLIYVHDERPGHSQNSGRCLPDEIDRYRARLEEANARMDRDLADLLAADPDGIVVVAGDHGPFLTRNCTSMGGVYAKEEVTRLDIQDRYGTFLAIRWPEPERVPDGILVLQDLFPTILTYLFDDPAFLKTRIISVTGQAATRTCGVDVYRGRIRGGVHDTELLYPEAALPALGAP